MSVKNEDAPARRVFLRHVGRASGATLAAPALLGGMALAPTEGRAAGSAESNGAERAAYLSLGPKEAACLEALVDVMCPADALSPRGVDAGLHLYIDRQLAGGWGRGDRLYRQGPWKAGKPQHGYQLALTPEQYFKAGIAALVRAVHSLTGKSVEELAARELDEVLQSVVAGKLENEGFSLRAWFNDSLYPLFVQACFADPMYGGNREKVFWRAVGFPGLPAVYSRDVTEYRGGQHPGSTNPKSIADLS
jgi:gluconate 2-dehydrogenase gamma chain